MIFLNLFGYYTEFYPLFKKPNNPFHSNSNSNNEPIKLKEQFQENSNPILDTLIKDFHHNNKPISCIGYGAMILFQAFEKNVWVFNKYNLTGISINEECREVYFPNLPFLIEESVRELDGNFVAQNNPNQTFVVVDRNLICGQNDSSLMIALNTFCFMITKQFLYNM